MPFSLDAGIAAAFASAAKAGGPAPVAPRGDPIAMRDVFNMRMELVDAAEPDSPSVRTADHMVPVSNGEILVRWYRKEGAASPGSAVVYYHGGGMVCGSVDLNDRLVSKYVEATGVPILSVDYRLAPEYPDTTLVGDGYAALAWFVNGPTRSAWTRGGSRSWVTAVAAESPPAWLSPPATLEPLWRSRS